MKKVTAFVGSAHKKNTYQAVLQFLNNLQALGDVEYEIVTLSDYKLGFCRGCRVCFEKGEQFCPLKDDQDLLMDKIDASDGVVFATPNYSWDMSGIMKTFLDRFGFVCHRPRYFGKASTSIVTQGIGRGDKIVEYFDFLGMILGFNTVKGSCVTALDPRTEKDNRRSTGFLPNRVNASTRYCQSRPILCQRCSNSWVSGWVEPRSNRCSMTGVATTGTTRKKAGSNLITSIPLIWAR